jgi:hypothetical protein
MRERKKGFDNSELDKSDQKPVCFESSRDSVNVVFAKNS